MEFQNAQLIIRLSSETLATDRNVFGGFSNRANRIKKFYRWLNGDNMFGLNFFELGSESSKSALSQRS